MRCALEYNEPGSRSELIHVYLLATWPHFYLPGLNRSRRLIDHFGDGDHGRAIAFGRQPDVARRVNMLVIPFVKVPAAHLRNAQKICAQNLK
jgi:hypothetical protein